MAQMTMKELLEAGVHFGHQTKRWNPKMQKYIFGERNGIYIIDLQKTLKKFREALRVRARPRRRRRHDAVRRHQEAGAGDGARGGRALRHVLRQPPLAGRHAHQLHDDPEVHRPAQEARRDEGDRRVRARCPRRKSIGLERERAKLEKALVGIKQHGPAALGGLHHRSARRRRSRWRRRSGWHPDRRHRGHQLRPDRDRLPDPGQRRRDPRGPAHHLADRRRGHRGAAAALAKEEARGRGDPGARRTCRW